MICRPRASDEALVELFLDMLAAERGAGENTLSAYRNDLEDLSTHLHATDRTIADARTDDLRAFLENLSKRGFKASSLARRLSAVRQLYRFLYAEGQCGDDPAAGLGGPGPKARAPSSQGAFDRRCRYATEASASELRKYGPRACPAPAGRAPAMSA